MPPRPETLAGKSIEGVPLDAPLDADHQIGHRYLMNIETLDDLRFAWFHFETGSNVATAEAAGTIRPFENDDEGFGDALRRVVGSATNGGS